MKSKFIHHVTWHMSLPFIVFGVQLLADERTTADVSSLAFARVRA